MLCELDIFHEITDFEKSIKTPVRDIKSHCNYAMDFAASSE